VAIKKKNSTMKKVTTTIICAILVMALMLPVAGLAYSCSNQDAVANNPGVTVPGGSTGDNVDAGNTTLEAMYAQTIKKYEDAILVDPNNYNNYELLGNMAMDWGINVQEGLMSPAPYTQKELFEKAIAAYTKRLALQPSPDVTVDRAIATFYNGDTVAAIALLEPYVVENAYFAPAWAWLGRFYEDNKQNDKARTAYEKALTCNPAANVKTMVEAHLASLPK
jgi:tetratricopeptide (TPR) repeat protein